MDSSESLSLRDLELRHLQALLAVTTEGTFGRAAAALGYTQSAVSQQIAGLEKTVGSKVFERPGGPKPVRLTPTGRVLLRHAERILESVSSLDRELSEFNAGVTGRIDIGVFQSVAVKVLPAVVGRLRKDAPGLDVRPFEARDDRTLVTMVEAGELDLTFAVGATHPSLRTVELTWDPFVAVVPATHPGGDTILLSDLDVVPLIGQPAPDSCQMKVDAGLADAGVVPDYVFRTTDNAAVQSMVRAGMGLAILPLLAVDTNDREVRVCSLEPLIPPRQLTLVVGSNPSPVTEQFIELAVALCDELVTAAPVAANR